MFIRKLWKLFSLASHFIIYQYCFISTVTDEEGKNANCEYIISRTHWRKFSWRSTVDYFSTTVFGRKKKERKNKDKKIVIISYPEN